MEDHIATTLFQWLRLIDLSVIGSCRSVEKLSSSFRGPRLLMVSLSILQTDKMMRQAVNQVSATAAKLGVRKA
jgi:hypothetical protein